MNKSEYLEALRKALEAKVPDMTDEVMADYETHFYMGLQDGKTEEQICEELGDIDEFVNELAGMGKADGDSSDKNGESSWEKQFNEQAQKFSESLNKGIDGFSKGVAEFATEFGKGISDLFKSEEFKNVKHSGEEFINFGSSFFKGTFEADTVKDPDEDDVVNNTDIKFSGKKNLVIDAGSADIRVEKSTEQVSVAYLNNGPIRQTLKYRFYFKEEGDTVYAGIRRSNTSAGLLWNTLDPNMVLTIGIPENMDKVTLNSGSGDMNLSGLKADEISIKTGSGDVDIKDLQTGTFGITTGSGDIDLDDLRSENLKICTSSGDVTVHGGMDKCYIKTVSGDVDLFANRDMEASITSVSGDADLRLNNNGNGYVINFQTTSGDVDIKYAGERHAFEGTGKFSQGNEGSKLYFCTVSGDISIKE